MKKNLLLIAVLLLSVITMNAQTITTIAGTSRAGYSGDGGPATAAQLNQPCSVAVDKNGNVFIADYGNSCLRKIDISTGTVSTIVSDINTIGIYTVAVDNNNNVYYSNLSGNTIYMYDQNTQAYGPVVGTGSPGWSGDGGQAGNAQINYVSAIAFDKNNNMYFTESIISSGNRDIRRVDAKTGIITTVAGTGDLGNGGDGGPAINATFNNPTGLAIDSKGNILIEDAGNMNIRIIDATTGIISLFCYQGSFGIERIVTDNKDNVYFVDYHTIYKIDAATKTISRIAGTGTSGYNGDNINATAAELYQPMDVALDKNGNLLIADDRNNRIRSVSNIASTLPVKLISFTASSTANSNQLAWQTGIETNSKGFEIQASTNGNDFSNVGFILAKGSNSNYQYTDTHRYTSLIIYYRLNEIDLDGSSSFSPVVSVENNNKKEALAIYPNPATSHITVTNMSGSINIYNVSGKLVFSQNATNGNSICNIQKLSAGIYFVKDSAGNTAKFIKQ